MTSNIGTGFCPGCHSLLETSLHHDFVIKMCTECDWYQVFYYRPDVGESADENEDDDYFTLRLAKDEWKLIHKRLKGLCGPIARTLTNKIAFHILGIYRCQ